MLGSWPFGLLETFLGVAVFLSTTLTLFLISLPSFYSLFDLQEIDEARFSDEDKLRPERSGYQYFSKYKDGNGRLRIDTTIQVVVLGDIGE